MSDLSTLSSLVVLLFFSPPHCRDIWTLKPFQEEVCFRVRWFLWPSTASSACFDQLCLGTWRGKRGTVRESGKGLQGNISRKIPQRCLCKHVLPRWFISRYLFVSWSTPPIINRPPCILKHFECVWCVRVYNEGEQWRHWKRDSFPLWLSCENNSTHIISIYINPEGELCWI